MIQGYVGLNFKKMGSEEFEAFFSEMKAAGIDFYRVDSGDSEYYHCLVQDPAVIDKMLPKIAGRSAVLQGAWDKHGVPYGKTKDAKTGEITGNAVYSFDKDKHLKHSKKIDPDTGEVTTETEFKPLHQFLGWEAPTEY